MKSSYGSVGEKHRTHQAFPMARPKCLMGDFTNLYGIYTVYPKKCAHGFCFAVLCCGYTLTDFPISIRLTSLALWQSNDCPSASKVTLMNMDKYFMWIHYDRLHNHNKAKHNKTVCIFLGIYCTAHQTNVWWTMQVFRLHCLWLPWSSMIIMVNGFQFPNWPLLYKKKILAIKHLYRECHIICLLEVLFWG